MSLLLPDIRSRVKYGRAIRGMCALLLPYSSNGEIDFGSYVRIIQSVQRAGLTCAVNMDTGFVNLLSPAERREVLRFAASTIGRGFCAGAFVDASYSGDLVTAYRREVDEIVALGGTPVLFQHAAMHALEPTAKCRLYADICRDAEAVIAFELSPVFAPFGEIWDAETFDRLLSVPQLIGAKHSSLDRLLELDRLETCKSIRPDFRVFTGNDLGIDMVEYGSDYLLGLAVFAPEAFALRDRYWEAQDARYFAVSDALQHLGNVAFRSPVPAYKHSAAVFLKAGGVIPNDYVHPLSLRRPQWEADILRDCAERLAAVL